jgi:hypothetical protein
LLRWVHGSFNQVLVAVNLPKRWLNLLSRFDFLFYTLFIGTIM